MRENISHRGLNVEYKPLKQAECKFPPLVDEVSEIKNYIDILMSKTLEQFIRDNGVELTPGTVGYMNGQRGVVHDGVEYVLRVEQVTEYGIIAYVRPYGRDGETVRFRISGNKLETI